MSEASFESQENVSQKKEEEGPDNRSQSQSEDTPNSLSDDTHMTEIDINDSETRSYDGNLGDKRSDGAEQARSNDSGVHKDTEDKTSSGATSTEPAKDAVRSQNAAKVAMAEEVHRSPAAELSVTSNGDTDTGHEEVFQRDLSHGVSSGPIASHTHNSPDSYGMTEGVVEVGPYTGSKSQPTSPTVAPSPAADSRLARAAIAIVRWREEKKRLTKAASLPGSALLYRAPLVVRQRSCVVRELPLGLILALATFPPTVHCKQILSEKLGRGSRYCGPELEAQTRGPNATTKCKCERKCGQTGTVVAKLAQTLAQSAGAMTVADTAAAGRCSFADLSLKSPELHEFGYNAETQKLLSKNGEETLLGAIQFFIAIVNTTGPPPPQKPLSGHHGQHQTSMRAA
ncbi:hypothetical protein NFI96_032139, partial [Prochilodus magdalenae]